MQARWGGGEGIRQGKIWMKGRVHEGRGMRRAGEEYGASKVGVAGVGVRWGWVAEGSGIVLQATTTTVNKLQQRT